MNDDMARILLIEPAMIAGVLHDKLDVRALERMDDAALGKLGLYYADRALRGELSLPPDEEALAGFMSSVTNAVKNVAKRAVDVTKTTIKNPVKGVKQFGQQIHDSVMAPIKEVIRKIGPEKAAMIAKVAAVVVNVIPGVGQVASVAISAGAAAILAQTTYDQYKAGKSAQEFQQELDAAMSRYDENIAALSVSDKLKISALLKTTQNSDEQFAAIIITLDKAVHGDGNARKNLNKMLAEVSIIPESIMGDNPDENALIDFAIASGIFSQAELNNIPLAFKQPGGGAKMRDVIVAFVKAEPEQREKMRAFLNAVGQRATQEQKAASTKNMVAIAIPAAALAYFLIEGKKR